MQKTHKNFESLLIVSFGGPEKKEDVIPFLENVLRGKNVPRARLEEVAEHYYHFDGFSPINRQVLELKQAIESELREHDINLPVFVGNRNWHPFLSDTVAEMKKQGIQRSLAFFTSAYSCYSGCRQYRENIADAQAHTGEGAPVIQKLRMFYNHPLYIQASVSRVRDAIEELQLDSDAPLTLLFSAHSIPISMADNCNYVNQLTETSRLVAEHFPQANWELVFQSRSGPPHQPWLEPDVCDRIEELGQEGTKNIVIMPVGFLSDHMEVLFDLDTEAQEASEEAGIKMARAKTVGTHPDFISMIRMLIQERTEGAEKQHVGELPCPYDVCPENCCLSGR